MLSTKLKAAAGNSADATLYVNDVFSTYLYTGNGSTQTITNGIDLAGKGGLNWTKDRSAANGHSLVDTVRGATKYLTSNTANLSQVDVNGLTSFGATGYSIGSGGLYNNLAETYVSWTFRKAAKFFDMVTYTGNGVAGRQIAHSLGVAPAMIMVKRTDSSGDWITYQISRGASSALNYLVLNTTAGSSSSSTIWNNTLPTSSVFTVGTNSNVNASGGTYVAYLFAQDTSSTGIIQSGIYNGTGTTGTTITLGWEPQFILIKRIDDVGDWYMFDSMRGLTVVGSPDGMLQPNTSAAETTGTDWVAPFATGFNVTSTSGGLNSGIGTYIYMAIRMPNKPPTSGTQVYAGDFRGSVTATANNVFNYSGFPVDFGIQYELSGSAHAATTRLMGAAWLYTTSTAAQSNVANPFATNVGWFPGTIASDTSKMVAMFKRAPGFFDVVCYTGTGSATTQAHNLTVVPELMIVKERSAVNNWWVYDVIDGNTKYSVLNSTAIPVTSSTAWNNTTPTASVFSIGTGANVNASAQTFVAYLFATLAGISKVGSYTGNGTGQAIACGFSAGARFVLIKRTDSTGDWYTFDSTRGLTSGSSPYLLLNSTAAEVTGNNGVYASTGGFTLGATAITTTNIATATYIFLAVA